MTNTIKKELLKENKKALQFLHVAHGFDFEKDILISKIDGKFTYNQVMKIIYENIEGKFTGAILVRTTKDYCFNRDLHHVKIKAGRFDIERTKKEYQYNIDTFATVGNFENIRKHKTKSVYIIAQSNELLTPAKDPAPFNDYTRYRIAPDGVRKCSDGRGNSWVDKITIMLNRNQKIEYKPYNSFSFYPREKRSDNINDYIDKSGYNLHVQRMDLKRRALALKAERDLNAVNNADYTEREKAVKDGINAVKKYIIEAVNNATNYDGAKIADRAATQFSYLMIDFDNLYKFNFKSITAKNNHFEKMETRINDILNGGKK